MPSRRLARELALQALYGAEIGHREPAVMIDETVGSTAAADTRTFVRELVLGTRTLSVDPAGCYRLR